MKHFTDIETLGLNPISDRIIAIGVLNVEQDIPAILYGENEKQILTQFWNAVKNSDELLTFNGDGFDIPFIIVRSLINNVKICENFNKIKITDIRKVVNSFFISYNKFSKGTLRNWAEILGITPETHNGGEMSELYLKKNWSEIKKHNEEDLFILKQLYIRCINCGVLK